MAKTSFLNMTNKVLARINQDAETDTSTATGHSKIIGDLINEAQLNLFTEVDWYSLYKTRTLTSTVYTADTIAFATFGGVIGDTASGLSIFVAGQQILISGSVSNDGAYTIDSVIASTITVDSTNTLAIELAGAEVTITAITYPVASDWGRTIDLLNVTENWVMSEELMRNFDEIDANSDNTGSPRAFAVQGDFLRLWPIPSGTITLRERYFKVPDTLTANADTSDLPIECENCLIHWAWYKILEYLMLMDQADRVRVEYEKIRKKALIANDEKIDRMKMMGGHHHLHGIAAPRLPGDFPLSSVRIHRFR